MESDVDVDILKKFKIQFDKNIQPYKLNHNTDLTLRSFDTNVSKTYSLHQK